MNDPNELELLYLLFNSKDLDSDFTKIVDDNFWELLL